MDRGLGKLHLLCELVAGVSVLVLVPFLVELRRENIGACLIRVVGLFAVPGNGDNLLLLIYLDFDLVRELELRVCGSFPGRVGAEVNVFCNDRGDFLC